MDFKNILKARRYAGEKHKGQVRKFEGTDYIAHPSRVAVMVGQITRSKKLITAAYLHDTLEDTDATFDEISNEFGKDIANIVDELTSVKEDIIKYGKAKYLANKMINMSDEALTIKLCDRFDNVFGLELGTKKFKDKYTAETLYILNEIDKKRKLNKDQQRIFDMIEDHLDSI